MGDRHRDEIVVGAQLDQVRMRVANQAMSTKTIDERITDITHGLLEDKRAKALVVYLESRAEELVRSLLRDMLHEHVRAAVESMGLGLGLAVSRVTSGDAPKTAPKTSRKALPAPARSSGKKSKGGRPPTGSNVKDRALAYLASHGPATTQELATAIHCTPGVLSSALGPARAGNAVKRESFTVPGKRGVQTRYSLP